MVRYKMLARDINSSPTQYRTWVVNGQPDLTGQFYTGDKSGPLPFVDVSAYAILDPNEVVDFNLPNPVDWNTTFRVLPESTYGSHLAVIDGYVYLFGGKNNNKIYKASLNNPADWVDTGARLPTNLGGAQLAVVDGYIYLFGGNNGVATNTIYSAPTTNPLTWTNNGPLLPKNLYQSQLAIIDGYIYLFGGIDSNNATNTILQASVTNPLSWINTGATLPSPLYGSSLAIIDGYTYLFGGLTSPNIPTASIFYASNVNPLTWSTSVFPLPYAAYHGQFFTVGTQGFLIAPTLAPASYTRILTCNLSSPLRWGDTLSTVPGQVSQSQLAIIYDRIWLFGGNGSSVIFANNSILKYTLGSTAVISYGSITRTIYDSTPNPLDLFDVIGFPNWKTDYGS